MIKYSFLLVILFVVAFAIGRYVPGKGYTFKNA